MEFTKELLKNIAKLTRIKLSEDELTEYTPQMQTILDSAALLQELDTSKVVIKPTITIDFKKLRKDEVKPSQSQKDALANAPHSESGYVKVWGTTFGESES